jgi:hypothetical protein
MYEFLKEKNVIIPIFSEQFDEVVTVTAVDDDCADLASLRWEEGLDDEDGDIDAYTVVELSGTKIHVRLDDLLMARHMGVAVVTGGIRPGGRCPNVSNLDSDPPDQATPNVPSENDVTFEQQHLDRQPVTALQIRETRDIGSGGTHFRR